MDDPTIFAIEVEDRAADLKESEPLEKLIEFREAIHNARLKRFDVPSYFIMTVNMSGMTKEGYASARKTLISIIMSNFFPSVIFCQELPGKFVEEVVKKCGTLGFDFVATGKQAAVMWIANKFDGERLNDSTEAIAIIERLKEERSDVDLSEVRTRTSMVLLSAKDAKGSNSPCFLAVSWHAPKKETVDNRKKVFQGLICFLQEICKKREEQGRPVRNVIIGGDFNLKTLEDLDLVNDVALGNYELSCRGMEASGRYIPYKDNFIFFNYPPPFDFSFRVSYLRAFEFENSVYPGNDLAGNDNKEVDALAAQRKDLLDHDPVIGLLQFFRVKKTAGKFKL